MSHHIGQQNRQETISLVWKFSLLPLELQNIYFVFLSKKTPILLFLMDTISSWMEYTNQN